MPYAGHGALVSFPADFVLLAYLLALGRFFTVSAALDTGSSFEGMGASREVLFAALAEPTLLLGFLALARQTGQLSLASILGTASPLAPEVLLVAAALVVVLLCETGRVPFDDPTTHLELTMIHEVMVLDHGGPDLALMQYAASLRLWLWSALVVGLLAPFGLPWPVAAGAARRRRHLRGRGRDRARGVGDGARAAGARAAPADRGRRARRPGLHPGVALSPMDIALDHLMLLLILSDVALLGHRRDSAA